MKNSYLSSLIETLQKQKNKLIYIDKLKQIFMSALAENYSDKKGYKLIYHLKNKGYLISLKKDIFCITHPEKKIPEEILLQQHYRSILQQHCNQSFEKRYIGGLTALQLHMHDEDIPDDIVIINSKKQSNDIVVSNKKLQAKRYTSQGKDLFPLFAKFQEKQKIAKISFSIACYELALLEALFSYDEESNRYTAEYIKKLLKKHEPDIILIEKIIKIGKHHSSINRLLDLCKVARPKLVVPLLQLIKKYSFVL